ncbi:twin-arginine translocation signal domain-containing protein [Streptomyces sp. BR123]|uniref:twin-arginine translocation signal domain-containing protein n=1 Tax=Streptomyces sp. BR123 TaxID=2749828 RepID=UPI00211B516F|nr:twin-arginine translocation signal domain-containing protein [Streptomyces sp. BR123]
MRNITRRGFVGMAATAVGAMALAGMPGQAVAAEAPVPNTPGAYVSWLQQKGGAGSAETIAQFKALPKDKQERFLGYLNKPEHFKAFMDVASSTTEKQRVLADGDIVISKEEENSNSEAAAEPTPTAFAATRDRSAWHSVSDTIFGIKVTTVKLGVHYRTTGNRVTKVINGWAGHTNFVPATTFDNSPIKNWISANPANNAHSETVWTGKFVGFGSWSCRHRVWADQDGFKGGYLKRV